MRHETFRRRGIRSALTVAVVLLTLASSTHPATAGGSSYSGGTGTNSGSGSSGVGGGNSQNDLGDNVPYCNEETGGGGFGSDPNVFVAPFPGCIGAQWQYPIDRCFTGYMVWRFYGTMRPGNETKVITRSRVNFSDWCLPAGDQKATFFYPNATDALGYKVPERVDGSMSAFGWSKWSTVMGQTMYTTDTDVPTTGPAALRKGSCTSPLVEPGFKNWMQASLSEGKAAAQKWLFDRYNRTLALTGSRDIARLDINSPVYPQSPSDITSGSTTDCSSIMDYWGYKELPAGQRLDPITERNNTVMVGTCAIPLERPGRLYTMRGQRYHAYYNDEVKDGGLRERYSDAKFNFGMANDSVIQKFKEYIATDAHSNNKMPLTPFWPSENQIKNNGSSAWGNAPYFNGERVANLVKCEYQTLAPATQLMGEIEPTPSPTPSPSNSSDTVVKPGTGDVYLAVNATLPRNYTASGDLKTFNVPTSARVLCGGRTCGTNKLDPRIVSWRYTTRLAGEGGYTPCQTKRSRNCGFYYEPGGKSRDLTAWFFSPTAKGQKARLEVTDVEIVIIPKQEITEAIRETRIVIDPVTLEEREVETVRYVTRIIELPAETRSGSVLSPDPASRNVTGSVGN